MTFEEFWKEYSSDLDVWNMGLEEYNHHRKMARKIWESKEGR